MDRASIPGVGLEELAPPTRVAGGPAAWLAVAVPLAFGLWSLGGDAGWAQDGAVVRDLGLLPAGSEGALSTLLTQLATLVPIGGRLLRAGLVGVFALALASRLTFGLVLGMLERRERSALNPALALFASLIWALGWDVLHAAGRVGGPLPALTLVLLGLTWAMPAFERGDARALAATGLALAAASAERRAAGASLALFIIGLAASERHGGWQRELWRLLGGFVGGLVLFGSLRAVGLSGSGSAAANVGNGEPLASAGELLGAFWRLPGRYCSALGSAPPSFAMAGVVLAARHAPSRRRLWPLVCLAALGVLAPAAPGAAAPEVLDGGLFGALGSLGVAALFPLGVQGLVRWLWTSPLPYGRPAAVLTVTFACTLVLSRTDRAGAPEAQLAPSRVWSDEALTRLPPHSFLLLHDERATLHLLAERVLSNARPDVTILPTQRLSVRALRDDPGLADPTVRSLLRQLWVNGSADEYSLSALADERPLFVEPEPDWDPRLFGHLVPEGLWLRFAPQGKSGSDRRAGTEHSRAALRRALELSGGHAGIDPGTRRALADAAARQARVLGALGERELAGRMAHAARVIERGAPATGGAQPARSRVAARVVSR